MRILFCLDFYPPHIGGAEILFGNLAEGLAAEGHEVHVVTQLVLGGKRQEIRNGVDVTRIPCFGSRHLFSLLCIPTLLRLARQSEIIHATTFASTLPAWLVSRLTGKPMILTVHEVWLGKWHLFSDASRLSNFINGVIERLIYLFDYRNYIAVSNATAKSLAAIGVPHEKTTVIHNGIDYAFWKFSQKERDETRGRLALDGNFVFLFTGRPGRSKGLLVLLEAFKKIHADHNEAHLLAIVSDNAAVRRERAAVAKFISENGMENSVSMLTPVPYKELPSYVSCADTVVIPSFSEGFGYAAAEACALGRPVIATDNASLPEVVCGKVLLVPPHDADALATAMEKALCGKFQTIPQKRFLISANVQEHITLYGKILDAHEKL
ncbi:MAG: glycosyltransferase family 4 protein [Victivallales bacterium]|nr:glycosyltransferase family 4 protein [Victivallales bacterium]